MFLKKQRYVLFDVFDMFFRWVWALFYTKKKGLHQNFRFDTAPYGLVIINESSYQ